MALPPRSVLWMPSTLAPLRRSDPRQLRLPSSPLPRPVWSLDPSVSPRSFTRFPTQARDHRIQSGHRRHANDQGAASIPTPLLTISRRHNPHGEFTEQHHLDRGFADLCDQRQPRDWRHIEICRGHPNLYEPGRHCRSGQQPGGFCSRCRK